MAEAIRELEPSLLVAQCEVVFPHAVMLQLDHENDLEPYLLDGPCREASRGLMLPRLGNENGQEPYQLVDPYWVACSCPMT